MKQYIWVEYKTINKQIKDPIQNHGYLLNIYGQGYDIRDMIAEYIRKKL